MNFGRVPGGCSVRPGLGVRAAALALSLWIGAAPTHAEDRDAVKPGTQANPPAPAPPESAPLELNERQRRAIRGCPTDRDCHLDLMKGLRAFELRAFPRRGAKSPWIDHDDTDGHNAVRIHGARGTDHRAGKRARKPSDLRPDLAWLDDVTLPDMPVVWHERVIKYLEFYKNDERGRSLMRHWLHRQARYRKMISRHLRKAGLPQDLIYVAMIESSYSVGELSRVGAAGLWQFMRPAGSIYGLRQSRWIDERMDPERSTKAAAIYFADLYQRFGDWHLALAAYNAGYGAVLKSMAKYNTNDYWRLLDYENALPWGTSLYVSKAIACAIIGNNRELFGFDDVKPAPELEWSHVTVPKSVPIGVIARAAGTDGETIAALNPQLRRRRTPPGLKDYVLRVPKGRARLFAERFPQLRGEWDEHDAYVVSHGERFEDIATMHGISYRGLEELNGIETEAEVSGGMVLVVPRVSEEEKAKNLEKAKESLYSSSVPPGEPGQKLLVAVPDPELAAGDKKRVYYRVVSGDTQYGIARAFGVSRLELAEWNGLAPEAHLTPRMVLQLLVARDFSAEAAGVKLLDPALLEVVAAGSEAHLNAAEDRMGRKRFLHEAKRRESFSDIGRRYGLTPRDLARINRRPPDTILEPGETVLIYQVVDKAGSGRAKQQLRKARRQRAGKRRRRR